MIHLLGDGLAGRLLARTLKQVGVEFVQYGDGCSNTPPVGFVHLFQGRTFHRDPIEVEAFARAIRFWRGVPWAREWEVERTVTPGDRLARSADTESVPAEWRPVKVAEDTYRYGPGFVVQARELTEAVPVEVVKARVDPGELKGTIIHATGLGIASLLPGYRWDTNPGRTVKAKASSLPDRLYLKAGCHLGIDPDGQGLTIGGRVSSKGEAKDDETRLASQILGVPVDFVSEWWGKRIANALDRWPLVGWLNEDTFVFAGFGGRAMFWLPYCCELASQSLDSRTNDAIPEKLRADRFRAD
ncbi:MAG: hypothetical protein WC314_09370 [Vulcanimicrobiota bacterium]